MSHLSNIENSSFKNDLKMLLLQNLWSPEISFHSFELNLLKKFDDK